MEKRVDINRLITLASVKMEAGQRKGQAYYNALYELNQSLAEDITGTDIDPFYLQDDEPLDKFFQWLENYA